MTYTERARVLRPYMATIRAADKGYLLNRVYRNGALAWVAKA